MKFIVLERHQAPVVSFLTYADVGGANEPEGKTGGSLWSIWRLRALSWSETTKRKSRFDRLDELAEQFKHTASPVRVAGWPN